MPSDFEPKNAQPGISVRPRQHLILAALDFNGASPSDCHAAMEALRGVVRNELADELADPNTETGELGFESDYDDYELMITLALSTSGYNGLGATEEQRPVDLHPIPPDVVNAADPAAGAEVAGEGDALLHIASNDPYIVEHVLRRIEHELGAQFSVRWVQTGVQRFTDRQKGSREPQRALIGFLDGVANLHMDDAVDRALVYVDHTRTDYPPNPTSDQYTGATFPTLGEVPTRPEPAALDGGSYMAVEVSVIDTAFFDAQPLAEQEHIVGRTKIAGDPANNADDASHTRKANPHRPGTNDEQRRFLRRGYPLIRTRGNALELGLIFVAFGRTLTTQVEFVRRAWINNPNFPRTGAGQDRLLFGGAVNPQLLVGGYYFVPPLAKHNDLSSWVIPDPGQPPASAT